MLDENSSQQPAADPGCWRLESESRGGKEGRKEGRKGGRESCNCCNHHSGKRVRERLQQREFNDDLGPCSYLIGVISGEAVFIHKHNA